jgi:hypothetical protein
MAVRDQRYRQPRRPVLLPAVLLLAMALAGTGIARAATVAQPVKIVIPAGRAIDSVMALARQTNLNILLTGRLAGDVRTNALDGFFTPAQAISQIVAGTSLTFAMVDENTATIWSCAEFHCAASYSGTRSALHEQ